MSQKLINITIDGGSGVGKGTITTLLTQKLNFIKIDSGSMYRTITYFMIEQKKDSKEITKNHLENINFNYKKGELYVNDKLVESLPIRTPDISKNSAKYSMNKEIREFVTQSIKDIMNHKGFILEGRDAGSVIAPNSEIKFYLECPVEIRAKRRLEDYKKQGILFTLDEVIQELEERDHRDKNRDISPLKIPKNAFIISNDDSKPLNEHVEDMYKIIQHYSSKL